MDSRQSRGVYPLGMTAVGSGVTPAPGFTYANQLLFYSRDESKADDGSTLPASGQNAVIMDMNSFVWVSRKTLLGGAHYSATATLPVAKNQLVSDIHGQLGGGSGFADSYYLPIHTRLEQGTHVDTRPGRCSGAHGALRRRRQRQRWFRTLDADARPQVRRYTSPAASPVTFSAFELYQWHTAQETTDTKPGDTFNLDYSLIRTFAPRVPRPASPEEEYAEAVALVAHVLAQLRAPQGAARRRCSSAASSSTAIRDWSRVSRSRRVTVPSSIVWWSTVTPQGVPISSWRR